MTDKQTPAFPPLPAFPQTDMLENGTTVKQGSTGMTLRQYYAAHAMQSLLMIYDREIREGGPGFDVCKRAYNIADRMIEADQP